MLQETAIADVEPDQLLRTSTQLHNYFHLEILNRKTEGQE